MMSIWNRSVVVSLLLCLALAATAAPSHGAAPIATDGRVRVGDMAPSFRLPTLNGSEVDLSAAVGKVPTLIVFWSYFCFPCQRELPALEELYRELTPDALNIIGISLDGPEYDDKVLPFLAQHGITFPNAYDRLTPEFFEVAEKYGVVGTPTAFLMDPQGRVRFIHLGRLEPDLLRGMVKSATDQAFCAEIIKPSAPAASAAAAATPAAE